MNPGDLVRVQKPGNGLHGRLGILVGVHNRWTAEVDFGDGSRAMLFPWDVVPAADPDE